MHHTPARTSAPVAATAATAETIRPTRRSRIGATIAATAAVLLSLGLGASPALAHDQQTGQVVVTDGNGKATGVKLSFNNEIIAVGSEIIVTAPDGTNGADGAPVLEGRDVIQNLVQPVVEGSYSFEWRLVSSDGHPIQGAFELEIDGSGIGSIHAGDHHGEDKGGDTKGGENQKQPEAVTPVSGQPESESSESNPLLTVGLVVLISLAVAGAATVAVVGGKRRRDAMNAPRQDENGTQA